MNDIQYIIIILSTKTFNVHTMQKKLFIKTYGCQMNVYDSIKIQGLLARSVEVKREEAGFFNPMLDLASARHELAFSRLFIS